MSWIAKESSSLIAALELLAPDSSKNTLRDWIKQGRISVEGKMIKDPLYTIKKGTSIALGHRKQFINYGIEILYEDQSLIVIHKPEGLLSVATDYSPYKNVHGFLKRRLPGRNVFPVHRLDRETSGVMMFAYTEAAKEHLKKQFEEHSIQREYIALVEGSPIENSGTWKSFLIEDETTYFVKSTKKQGLGKEAITHYTIMQKGKFHSMLKLRLETGKKNQIRVHCSEAGFPIVGDEKYGSRCPSAPRVYLHAALLGFIHPELNKPMLFERKPSPEFFNGMKCRIIKDPLPQLNEQNY
jgi:tRNA pseudouridine32 synthase/23S rRNA pseudouridine746 synthase/23S rRNA pseudouridine1911/1915/1917 synthase